TRLSPIENKSTSKPNLNTQTSLESESRNSFRTDTETDILRLSSPKTASRLAPLDKNTEIIKIKKEDLNKSKSSQEAKSDEKVDLNWKRFIEPLVNQMDIFFRSKSYLIITVNSYLKL
ncbi:unnamed protein product, partial [Brachionus calyciflorus]